LRSELVLNLRRSEREKDKEWELRVEMKELV
jgi:hypothetical protein